MNIHLRPLVSMPGFLTVFATIVTSSWIYHLSPESRTVTGTKSMGLGFGLEPNLSRLFWCSEVDGV